MSEFVTAGKVGDVLREVFLMLDARFELPSGILSRRREAADAWSIAEHLEHVSLANRFLLLTIHKGCRTALKRAGNGQQPVGESDLDLLDPIAVPGAFEWLPPAHMLPTGKALPGEVRERLRAQREECLELVRAMPRGEGRLCSIRMSVNRWGWLDMYQWLYFLAQHARYHLVLIDELVERGALPSRPEGHP